MQDTSGRRSFGARGPMGAAGAEPDHREHRHPHVGTIPRVGGVPGRSVLLHSAVRTRRAPACECVCFAGRAVCWSGGGGILSRTHALGRPMLTVQGACVCIPQKDRLPWVLRNHPHHHRPPHRPGRAVRPRPLLPSRSPPRVRPKRTTLHLSRLAPADLLSVAVACGAAIFAAMRSTARCPRSSACSTTCVICAPHLCRRHNPFRLSQPLENKWQRRTPVATLGCCCLRVERPNAACLTHLCGCTVATQGAGIQPAHRNSTGAILPRPVRHAGSIVSTLLPQLPPPSRGLSRIRRAALETVVGASVRSRRSECCGLMQT